MAAETGHGYLVNVMRGGARPFFAPTRSAGRTAHAPTRAGFGAPSAAALEAAPAVAESSESSSLLTPQDSSATYTTHEHSVSTTHASSDTSADTNGQLITHLVSDEATPIHTQGGETAHTDATSGAHLDDRSVEAPAPSEMSERFGDEQGGRVIYPPSHEAAG